MGMLKGRMPARTLTHLQPLRRYLLALAAGATYPLSFAPFDLWWLGIAAVGLLYWALSSEFLDQPLRARLVRAGLLGWCFGVGAFGVGASWIYVSINVYGGAPPALAAIMVALFVVGTAWFFGLQGVLFGSAMAIAGDRAEARLGGLQAPLTFALLWPLTEWARSWILTGFPWLYAGYAHLETPLAAFAPVGGVLLVSFAVAVGGSFLTHGLAGMRNTEGVRQVRVLACSIGVLPWPIAALLGAMVWVTPDDRWVSVAAVQPNIDQAIKWHPDQVQNNVDRNELLSAGAWGRDLVVWSEASLTFFPEQGQSYLSDLDRRAREAGTALVVGIPHRGEAGEYYNSAMLLGSGNGNVYLKRHLVPFGEYVPLEGLLRGLIGFFDLPMSRNRSGPSEQEPLAFSAGELSLSICYEIVYGELVRNAAPDPAVLVTISNDTWFGRSIGPLQHMQMARMRALEMGRYLVRATNNGVSAVVDPAGRVIASAPQFEPAVVRSSVRRMNGQTPYAGFGSWPLLAGLALGLVALLITARANAAVRSG